MSRARFSMSRVVDTGMWCYEVQNVYKIGDFFTPSIFTFIFWQNDAEKSVVSVFLALAILAVGIWYACPNLSLLEKRRQKQEWWFFFHEAKKTCPWGISCGENPRHRKRRSRHQKIRLTSFFWFPIRMHLLVMEIEKLNYFYFYFWGR